VQEAYCTVQSVQYNFMQTPPPKAYRTVPFRTVQMHIKLITIFIRMMALDVKGGRRLSVKIRNIIVKHHKAGISTVKSTRSLCLFSISSLKKLITFHILLKRQQNFTGKN
jgi:hypothetical protein